MPDPIALLTLLSTQTVEQLMRSGEWEALKQLRQHDDQPGAAALVDRAIDNLDPEKVGSIANVSADAVDAARRSLKEDVRYGVLAIESMEDRSIYSTLLELHSAEEVGKKLAGATEGLTKATEDAGRDLAGATRGLKAATWWLVVASGALALATVARVIITWIKHGSG